MRSEGGVAQVALAVGAFKHDHSLFSDPGAAYVLTRNGSVWSLEQKLIADQPATDDWFGYKVAISGDTVVVAAIQHNTVGATYRELTGFSAALLLVSLIVGPRAPEFNVDSSVARRAVTTPY